MDDQAAALRMAFEPGMQQVVEVALGIAPTHRYSPDEILDKVAEHIRSKRNIALDRVAFEECRQEGSESFEDFHIRLRALATSAELCRHCVDSRMATRIMAGIQDTETKKKLLAHVPFPTALQAVNNCRSDETARINERQLSGQAGISALSTYKKEKRVRGSLCGSCGRRAHTTGETCQAKLPGRSCDHCKKPGHYQNCCPTKPKPPSTVAANFISPSAPSQEDPFKIGRVAIRSVSTSSRRKAPTISIDLLNASGSKHASISNVIPDGGAEVTVAGLDVLSKLGVKEKDLPAATFDLVMANKSTPLLTVGQLIVPIQYKSRKASLTVDFSPEITGMLIS